MIDDELIRIWQSSPNQERIKFEKSRLMLELKSSIDRMHRWVKYGILIEQIGGIIVVPVFLFYVYWVPFTLSKIASGLIALWGIWYLFRLKAVKKLKPTSVSGTYLAYLHQNRVYLSLLESMGNTALYWYILPIISGALLFLVGYVIGGVLKYSLLMVIVFSSVIGTGIALFFYSKWITKKQYTANLKKIDALIKVMEE